MHELSLAENMIEAALAADGVTSENLRVLNVTCSCLSGVNARSLEFCLHLVGERRNLREMTVHIAETPAEMECECGCCYRARTIFCACPRCGSLQHRIAEAEDVLLESVEVEDDC